MGKVKEVLSNWEDAFAAFIDDPTEENRLALTAAREEALGLNGKKEQVEG